MENNNVKAGIILAGIVLFICSLASAYHTIYYSQRNQIRARLAATPNVEIVDVSGDDHLTYYHTKFVEIRLKDQPNSFIGLEAPIGAVLEESDHILLSAIGPLRLGSAGHTYINSRDQTTGELTQVKTECGYGSIDIGPGSPVADRLPVTVRNLDDLIAHYSELEAFFAGRPDEKQEGEPIRRDGDVVTCYLPGDCHSVSTKQGQ